MSCYECGKYGHKKEKCPQRISKIKCYECKGFGHYKNNCPMVLEREKVALEIKKQEELNFWVKENLPDVHKTLKNKIEITNFL